MSDFVLDASLTLQWFLEDEAKREYSLAVLASLSEIRALVPMLWFYEVGNDLIRNIRDSNLNGVHALRDSFYPIFVTYGRQSKCDRLIRFFVLVKRRTLRIRMLGAVR